MGSAVSDKTAGGAISWYHTLELPGGVVTSGWFDLRGQLDLLPWPDVRGKRCLDIATYDGFYAFELERRGAAEVIATDIPGHEDWDWPAAMRARADELTAIAGEKGLGFDYAHAALASRVEKRQVNIYDLDPGELGTFDMVVCGSLLLHLRDPVRALEAIRTVCAGWFMSVEAISLPLSILFRHRPVAELCNEDERCQWWTVNVAGHRRLLEASGFELTRAVGPFSESYGPAHPAARPRGLKAVARGAFQRAFAGGRGVPHSALLACPVLSLPAAGPR